MEAKKIYSKYDKQVQDYMQNVIDCLKQDYKNIPSSWRISLDLIADKGYDPQFGARPVKRVIQKMVLNELSKELLGGRVNRERPIVIDRQGEQLIFRN